MKLSPNLPVLRFAAVPISPRLQIEQVCPDLPRQPLVITARGLRQNPALAAVGAAAESDHYLLQGSLQRARGSLSADARRLAVLDVFEALAAGRTPDLAGLRAVEEGPTDFAVARMLECAVSTPGDAQVRLRAAMASLRQVSDATAVSRLGLGVALAYAHNGQMGPALSEALRAQAQGEASGDRALARHARAVVTALWGAHQDARVDTLIDVTLSLGTQSLGSVGPGQVFQRVAAATLELVADAQRAFVLAGEHDALEVRGAAFQEGAFGSPSLSIAAACVLEGREVITREVQEVAHSASIEAMDLRTVICIPLGSRDRVLGVLYADSSTATDQELQEVAWLVRAFAAYAAVVLRNHELLEQANRRSSHAREVAHDLRNVASGMRLALDDFGDFELPPALTQTVSDLNQMGRMLVESLEDLVEERLDPRVVFDLSALVEASVNLMRFQARARQVALVYRGLPVEVCASTAELGRVVANLVGNALKYSESGDEVRVEVSVREGRAVIVVADQGPGVPVEAMQSIFASGVQAPGARQGHGLGLAICMSIVERHGGSLQVRNRARGGSAFTVALPLP